MLWLKAFHLIAVISWMAVLLYLPRLFVNLAEVSDKAIQDRLVLMMQRLLKLGGVAMALSIILGAWLLGKLVVAIPDYFSQNWLHVKLVLVFALVAFHVYCGRSTRQFAKGQTPKSAKFYRWINEIPALIMAVIVILVIVRPF